MAEFLDEVRVGHDVEAAAAGGVGEELPVAVPRGFDAEGGEAGDEGRVVEVPRAEVMDTADEIVPRGHFGEFVDPWGAAVEPVDFEAHADGDAVGGCGAGLLDPFEVLGQFFGEHAPVVEGLGHGAVVGEADFGEAEGEGVGDEGFRGP